MHLLSAVLELKLMLPSQQIGLLQSRRIIVVALVIAAMIAW
jgi:hypothetical protein